VTAKSVPAGSALCLLRYSFALAQKCVQRRSFEKFSSTNDGADFLGVADVQKGILVQQHQVREFALLYSSEIGKA
jgi:hypothetical protein